MTSSVAASSAADASFCWRAADLQDRAKFTRWWSEEELAAFEAIAASPAASSHQASDPGAAPALAPVLQRALALVRQELQSGRGFVLLRGLPFERWSVDQSRIATWAIAHA